MELHIDLLQFWYISGIIVPKSSKIPIHKTLLHLHGQNSIHNILDMTFSSPLIDWMNLTAGYFMIYDSDFSTWANQQVDMKISLVISHFVSSLLDYIFIILMNSEKNCKCLDKNEEPSQWEKKRLIQS